MNDYMRREVLAMFGGRCGYCGVKPGKTVDHIRSLSRAGCDFIDNCLPACKDCNNVKDSMTVNEFRSLIANVRNGIMPYKKTAQSEAGKKLVELASRFQGEHVVFWFETHEPQIATGWRNAWNKNRTMVREPA
jgi:hypothetical protein